MNNLTADELTVLMIAAQGQPMIPIGRWKAPIERLVSLGYLEPTPSAGDPSGQFNLRITKSGREACEKADDSSTRNLLEAGQLFQAAQNELAQTGERVAKILAQMAETSVRIKPTSKKEALREWSRVILERALELIGE